jgi:hypothetical protein
MYSGNNYTNYQRSFDSLNIKQKKHESIYKLLYETDFLD